MKFKRIIAVSLISALSLGILVAVASGKQQPTNRTFHIKTVSGNPDQLSDAKLTTIMKTDSNQFEKVTISHGKTMFSKIEFDEKYRVGPDVLNHKALYRKNAHANSFESEKEWITAYFDPLFSYRSQDPILYLAREDKKTGKVTKNEMTLPDIASNDQIMNEALQELNGQLYYIVTSTINEKSFVKLYSIDAHSLALKHVMSEEAALSEGTYVNLSNIVHDQNAFYMTASNDKEATLALLDPAKKTLAYKPLPKNIEAGQLQNSIFLKDGRLYLQSEDGKLHVADLAATQKDAQELKVALPSEVTYFYAIDLFTKNNQLFVLYSASGDNPTAESSAYIAVYDQVNGKNLFTGKMPGIKDHGLQVGYSFVQSYRQKL
ncbi:hypothetical protein [Bacillus testis]|uniref:hypothetical protein n=1 Tax=Bacillus testis TaxID=1622072 RepID=UPI00067F404A|nr:hypothetical protein [Bacillus testis]